VSRYFESQQFGPTRVTVVDEGSGIYRAQIVDDAGQDLDPYGPENPDGFWIGFHVVHIRTPEASILVDAGFDDPESEWGRTFSTEWFVTRTPGLAVALDAVGESAETITHVAVTHAHFDHVAGLTRESEDGLVPRYPNATVLLGRDDADRIGEPREDAAAADIDRRLSVIRDAGLLVAVEGRQEISPGVNLIHTGGESPGHSIVALDDGDGCALFLAVGDLFHYSFEVSNPGWMAPWVDRDEMVKARQSVTALAAQSNATVVFSHHPFPPWGQIVESEGGYAWQPQSKASVPR